VDGYAGRCLPSRPPRQALKDNEDAAERQRGSTPCALLSAAEPPRGRTSCASTLSTQRKRAGRVATDATPLELVRGDGRQGHVHVRRRRANEELIRGDASSSTGRLGGELAERRLRLSPLVVGSPPNASLRADAPTTREGSNRQKLLIAAYPSGDQAGSTTKMPLKPASSISGKRSVRIPEDAEPRAVRHQEGLARGGTGSVA
jgi:hypothetical protein